MQRHHGPLGVTGLHLCCPSLGVPWHPESHTCQLTSLMVNLNGQLDWICNQLQDTPMGGSVRHFGKEFLKGSPIPAEWAVPCSWGPDVWMSKERQCYLLSVSDSDWWDQTSVLLLAKLSSFWWKNLSSLSFRSELMISDSLGILRPSGSD